MSQPSKPRVLLAITGASGVRYGMRLAEILSEKKLLEAVIVTSAAEKVAEHEEGIRLRDKLEALAPVYDEHEIDAPYASSSRAVDAMVVAPCSMKTLAAIAHGFGGNLVTRAALAHLRLRRSLILVIRETPLSLADIENMRFVALMGAVVLPASPGFYHQPRSVDDMIDFIVGKVLDVLGVGHSLYRRWRSA